jgi:hypothetical protein
MLTLGWMDAARDSALRLHLGRIGSGVGAFTPTTDDPSRSGRLLGLSARQGFTWGRSQLSGQLDWMRVFAPNGPHSELRASVQWQIPLD